MLAFVGHGHAEITAGHLFKEVCLDASVIHGDKSWELSDLSGQSIYFEITEPAGTIGMKLSQLDKTLYFLEKCHPELFQTIGLVGVRANGAKKNELDKKMATLNIAP